MIQLRDYQKTNSTKAVQILNKYKIVYFSFEVRTGKTLTALATAQKYGAKKVLFATKKKAISSIKSDYEALNPGYQIDIINYESIHKIQTKDHDLIILDEAHKLGAFPKPSGITKKLKHFTQFKPIIYLSGTPTPESYSQIFHQLWVSSYSPFANYKGFYKWAVDFVKITTKRINGFDIRDYSNAKSELINRFTKHLFLSYTQKEAGFESTIQEQVLYVDMKQKTKDLKERLLKDGIIEGKKDVILADTSVKMQQKIHQLSSGTIKADSGDFYIIDTTKADFIKSRFKGLKIAIYYKFKAERQMLLDAFPNASEKLEDNADIFISQIVSGREGVNLSAYDCLIFINIDFSATSYLQARDRLTSKDRTKENRVYWIFSKDGIESKIYDLVKNKEDYTVSHFRNDFNKNNN